MSGSAANRHRTMTTRVHIEHAKAAQAFFGLPEHTGTPVATVNGTPAPLKDTPSGILLTTPAAQGDIVEITFDQLYYG